MNIHNDATANFFAFLRIGAPATLLFAIEYNSEKSYVHSKRGRANRVNYIPEDLENIKFCKAFIGGYNKNDVDEAVKKVAVDYREKDEKLIDLENQLAAMEEVVNHYKTIEESMQHCLILAQHTSDEMIKSANEKAKSILSDADATSQKIVGDAYQQANKIKFSYEDMKAKIYSFKVKNEALLKSQLDVLSQLSGEPNG